MTNNEKTVLEKLVDELRAELSTTQLNCDLWHDRAEDMRKRLSETQADNAKLRELVSWMYDRMDESCAVQHPYAPTPISYDRLMQALARARELGVEVDG